MSGIIKLDTRASSGNMTTSNQYIVYWIECIQNSQSVSNNTSNVTVKVHIKRTNTGYTTYGSGTVYCKINGTTYSASIASSQKITSTAITLFTKTLTISHSSGGTKSLTMSAWVSHSQFSSNEQSYTQTLTTIPRASSISVTSSVEAGKSVTVTINRASSSFTHKVYYSFGSNKATISTSATTSASYTIPISHVNAIPNATSGTATISVDTYNGSTYIGSSSKTFTITVPSTVKPTLTSLTAAIVESGASTSYGYVKGKSKCNLVINGATGSHGSTIKSYSITGGGFSSSESSFTTGALTSSGNITFTATVTDSRGRKSDAKTVTINVLDYTNPNIASFSCIRCDSNGVADGNGTYLKILATYAYSSLSNGNSVSTKVEYKKTSTSIWINAGSIVSGSYIVTGSNNISTESAYDVRLTITDNLTSISKSIVIPASFITLDFKRGGKGIAIGKIAESDNLLDVDVSAKFNKSVDMDDQLLMNGEMPSTNTAFIRVNTKDGNTFGDGNTHIGYRTTEGKYNHYFRGNGVFNIHTNSASITCNTNITKNLSVGGNITSSSIYPLEDGVGYLGETSNRWLATYSSTGNIYSSSKDEKECIERLDISVSDSVGKNYKDIIKDGIKSTPMYSYRYKMLNNEDVFVGFLGQELEYNNKEFFELIGSSYSVDENIVQYDIRETSVLGVLWSALQDSLIESEKQEEKINQLENKVEDLAKELKLLCLQTKEELEKLKLKNEEV